MKRPSFQFYPGDWMKDPSLGMCSPSARGIWIDLLCCIHELNCGGRITGTAEQLARLCRCTPEQFTDAADELSTSNAADVTSRNGVVTVVCRRMRAEFEERESTKERVKRYRDGKKREGNWDGNADCNGDCNENVTPYSSSSPSSSVHTHSPRARAGPAAEESDQAPSPRPSSVAHGGFLPNSNGFAETPSLDEWLEECRKPRLGDLPHGLPDAFSEEKYHDLKSRTVRDGRLYWVARQWRDTVDLARKWFKDDVAEKRRDVVTGREIRPSQGATQTNASKPGRQPVKIDWSKENF